MVEEKHEGLPVSGYQPQSAAAVALVNEFKTDEERLLRKLDAMRDGGGRISGAPHYDQRWTAIARSHFEQGFMALNRSVFQPGRVKLPEDEQ